MQIKDIDSAKDFIDKTKALETYAKATKKDAEMVMLIQEQKIRSMRILGELLKATDFDKGAMGIPGNQYSLVRSNNTTTPKPTLADYGLTKDESSVCQTIAAIPETVFEDQMHEIKTSDSLAKEITVTRFKNSGRDYKRQEKIEKAVADKWPQDQEEMKKAVERGETVVINMNAHYNLLKWAEDNGLYVRVDRFSDWGNPFELGKDGDRDEVCDSYSMHYFPFKKSLHPRVFGLKGKVLGCHCHPKRCHAHFIADQANSQ